MSTVAQMLQTKGGAVWAVTPQTTVYEALELMARRDCGAVVVLDDGRLTGIFTERDYARKVVLLGRSSKTTPVAELMATKVYFVKPDSTDEDCMRLMTAHRVRHLPVLENEKLSGVISIGDVVKSLMKDREFTIKQLENYITGQPYPASQA